MLALAFVKAAPGGPLFLRPLSKMADSCIGPATVIDPVFLPRIPLPAKPRVVEHRAGKPFVPKNYDPYFYLLCGVFFFVGLTRRAFPKYYSDMYRVFSQSGFRQKSIRDQLLQNKVASIGLNVIFFVTGGVFIYLVSINKGILAQNAWYLQVLICIGFLMAIYGTKYIALMTGGWVFGSGDLLDSYSFIVFFVNKIAGLFLLPVILFLWLGVSSLHASLVSLSFLVLSLLFLYRFFLVLPLVRSRSGVSSFHFFIYLCTFEIIPILLLVKFLVNFLNTSV